MIKNGIKIKELDMQHLMYKPPGFWISINGEWEEWSESNEFGTSDGGAICHVKLKNGLKFLKISTLNDAKKLLTFLLPDIRDYRFGDFGFDIDDSFSIINYVMEKFKKGKIITPGIFWKNVMDNFDGVYFENSSALHFDSMMFNTWDASSIVVFDANNVKLSLLR